MKRFVFYIFKILIYFIIFVCLILIACELEHKKVKLEYVGTVILDRPYPGVRFWNTCSGEYFEKELKEELSYKYLKLWDENYHNGDINYKIQWINGFKPDRDAYYYMGFGYKIKGIRYYYHTKFTSCRQEPNLFEIFERPSLLPADKRKIYLYKGDVIVWEGCG